jgi:hypothetical protein
MCLTRIIDALGLGDSCLSDESMHRPSPWGAKSNPGIACLVFDTDNDTWLLSISKNKKTVDHKLHPDRIGQKHSLRPSPKTIINRIHRAGLETRLEYSEDWQHLFCFIALPMKRMCEWADQVDIDMLVDPVKAVEFGRTPEVEFPLAKRTILPGEPDKVDVNEVILSEGEDSNDESDIQEDFSRIPLEMWYDVFIQYDQAVPQDIFKRHKDGSIFSAINQLQMLEQILTTDTDMGGAGLKIDELHHNKSHPAVAVFAIESYRHRDNLIAKGTYWKFWGKRWHDETLNNMRNYYGEKIAFYFAFLQFYTMALNLPSFVGFFYFGLQLYYGRVACPTIELWIIFLITWNLMFCKLWERRENMLRKEWGMFRYSAKAVPRPQFTGKKAFSPITGNFEEVHASHRQLRMKLLLSYSSVFFWCCLVFAAVLALFVIKQSLEGKQVFAILISMSNAILIQVYNFLYLNMVERLNAWENHRLQLEYENQMIVKKIVFQLVNSFASLFFIGFVKPIIFSDSYMIVEGATEEEQQQSVNDEILSELRLTLGTLFLTLIFIQNTQEVVFPQLKKKLKMKLEKHSEFIGIVEGDEGALISMSQLSKKASKKDLFHTYEVKDLKDDAHSQLSKPPPSPVIDNMSEMIVEQGYATMFAIAFPLTPLLALCNNYVEFRVDSHNLTADQRPIPVAAYGVGLWGRVLWIFAFISVLTNWYLLIFRTDLVSRVYYRAEEDQGPVQIVAMLFGVVGLYLGLGILNLVILSHPPDLDIHKARSLEIEKWLIIKGAKSAAAIEGSPRSRRGARRRKRSRKQSGSPRSSSPRRKSN